MGVVFEARHAELGRPAALKTILPGALGADAEALERFRREARAAGALATHPGIVGVHDSGEHQGQLWLAMDLVVGQPLDDLIEEAELSHAEVARIVAEAARAVHHAHGAGILHRDLKPANILVETGPDGEHGAARVTDFGLARHAAADAGTQRLTQSDAVIGTPAYMPPEQALGGTVDARSDVWALGATLYAAIAGQGPFGDGTVLEILGRVIALDPTPLRARNPSCPIPLEAIAMQCLEKDPARRYPSAAALADDLERFGRGDPVQARSFTAGRRAVRWAGRHRAGLVAAAVLAIAAPVVWWQVRGVGASDAEHQRQSDAQTAAEAVADQARRFTERFTALAVSSMQDLRRCEDAGSGAPIPAAERDAALARVEQAAAGLAPEDGAEPAVAAAWRASAQCAAGEAGALQQLRDAAASAGGDPFPHLLLARALLLQWSRGQALPDMEIRAGTVRIAPLVETDQARAWREEAQRAVTTATALPGWAHLSAADGAVAFAAGVEHFAAERYGDAAAALDPVMEDPLFGGIAMQLAAMARLLGGAPETAAGLFERLARRGWIHAQWQAARSWMNASVAIRAAGDPVEPALANAARLLDAALTRMPSSGPFRLERAMICVEQAQSDAAAGRDESAALAEARRHLEVALQANRTDPFVRLYLAVVTLRQGMRERRVHDPAAGETLRAAVAQLTTAIGWPRVAARAVSLRAAALHELARHALERGQDPSPFFEQADTDFQWAVDHEPGSALPWVERGIFWVEVAGEQASRQRDADAAFQRAVTALDKAVALDPTLPWAWRSRALAWRAKALADVRVRRDPRDAIAKARADLQQVLALGSDTVDVRVLRGSTAMMAARAAMAAGRDPLPDIDEALTELTIAVDRTPNAATPRNERGMAWLTRASHVRRTGGDAADAWAKAQADFDAAIAHHPEDEQAYLRRAEVNRLRAAFAFRDGHPDFKLLEACLADLDHAVRLVPKDPRALIARSFAASMGVKLAQALRQDPEPWAQRALADLTAAAALGPLNRQQHDQRINLAEALRRWPDMAQACRDALRDLGPDPGLEARLREAEGRGR